MVLVGRVSRFLSSVLFLLLPATPRLLAADVTEFTVLSYNTHGLPAWIARDQPEQRFPQIARFASAYDVALFQEAFVDSYWKSLAAGLSGRFLERGNGRRAGWLSLFSPFCGSCGSGLATGIDVRLKADLLGRGAYESCSGWMNRANDCWANKGYLAMRVTVPNGDHVDIYTVHLDAGRDPEDHAARSSQLEILQSEIERLSGNRSIIIGGDFNLDNRTPRDSILLERFAGRLHLQQSGAAGKTSRWTEGLDHILYRSGEGTQLDLVKAGEATEFVRDDAQPLSDHPAVFAQFKAH